MNVTEVEDDEERPWFVRPPEPEEDEEAGQGGRLPGAGPFDRLPADADENQAAVWAAAEASLMGPLAEAAHLLGRLDERLRIDATTAGRSLAEGPLAARLRTAHAVDQLWAAGWTVRPERLALYATDGGAPRGAEPGGRAEGYALGLWLLGRLGRRADLTSVDGVAGFLGIGGAARRREVPEPLEAIVPTPDAAMTEAAIGRFLALDRALRFRHPLTRGAALADHWLRDGPTGNDRALVATLLGARRSLPDEDPSGRRGLVAAPIVLRLKGRARSRGDPLGEAARGLEDWVAAARGGAERALAVAAAVDVWRARAEPYAAAAKGGTAARLVAALTRHEALSSSMAAAALGVSQSTAERQLARLEAAGLAREITGAAAWRFWTARA